MATIYIDNKEYEVDDKQNLLEAVLSLGFDLPYFCWHPVLRSVGACRQCGIIKYRNEEDTQGRITMACMEPASDGTRISIEDPGAHKFRAENIESLMINHPHDCAVCDEGGECHLQDMTLMSGHNYRRYRFKKRTHVDQYLGPFINHEMNRCIQCYRCVRFYNDYAEGGDFGVFGAHDDLYFGRFEDGMLENEFSGNLVEVCPTGVFTDKTLKKNYTRKWDLTNAPSICQQCGLGCNTIASERYGNVRRILTRYNGDVNGYFLCDRGRFGYEYANSEKRILHPLKKVGGTFTGVDYETAINDLKELTHGDKNLIGIGSPRASLESNYLLRELVGEDNFYAGVPTVEGEVLNEVYHILQEGKVKTPSLGEAETYDTVFVLGEDVTNTAPMLALAIRQAAKNKYKEMAAAARIPEWNDAAIRQSTMMERGPVYIADLSYNKLEEIATKQYHAHPDDLARLGMAVAQKINSDLPQVELDTETDALAAEIAEALIAAKKPLIVSGTSTYSKAVVQAASNIAHALKDKEKDAGLIYAVPEVNSMGLTMMTEQYLEDALEKVGQEKPDATFVLENDLYRRIDARRVRDFYSSNKKVVLLESLANDTGEQSDYVLPAGTFAEADGTMVNNEGRAQRFYQVHVPENESKSSWKWLDAILQENGPRILDEVVASMMEDLPVFKDVEGVAPDADFRKGTQKIPRQPHRFSGRTAMNAHKDVSEPKPPVDRDSALSFTMEGYQGRPPSSITPFNWRPAWNSVQSINKYQIEVGGPLHDGNPGKRLIEPSEKSELGYFNNMPESFTPRNGEWQALPLYHIYGSDELSAESPAVQERTPEMYLALNNEDAEKAGFSEGDILKISYNGTDHEIVLSVMAELPRGVIGLPKGLEKTKGVSFPFWTTLNRS